ncbi:shikimate kinase [Acetivibrio sp. MSJd-27]|uniref:shikimate kinase n=1 Tax=Acetivibrio sp. MSJd-27 TaxID=2841523 RepID=UPI00209FFDBA|nr:shikimate kinase [Acetivibrio sp. MSJd-27]
MGTGILVCGCNGSGKSTLGKQLAKELHYHFIDIETLYFPKINADYVYGCPRSAVKWKNGCWMKCKSMKILYLQL